MENFLVKNIEKITNCEKNFRIEKVEIKYEVMNALFFL